MNLEELREINSNSYDKWFERWYEKQNLSNKIKQSAMKGYTSFYYEIDDTYSSYEKRRMNDNRFVDKLKSKLEEFHIYRVEPKKYERSLLGQHLGYGWTNPKIVISWKD